MKKSLFGFLMIGCLLTLFTASISSCGPKDTKASDSTSVSANTLSHDTVVVADTNFHAVDTIKAVKATSFNVSKPSVEIRSVATGIIKDSPGSGGNDDAEVVTLSYAIYLEKPEDSYLLNKDLLNHKPLGYTGYSYTVRT